MSRFLSSIKNIKEYYDEHEDINDPIWKLYNDLISIHDKYDACTEMLKLFDYFVKHEYTDIITDEQHEATKDLPFFRLWDDVNVERSVVKIFPFNNSLCIADVKDRTIKSIIDGEDIVLKIGKINHDRDRYEIKFGMVVGELCNHYSFRTVHNKKKVYAQLLYYIDLLINIINQHGPNIIEHIKTHKYDDSRLYGSENKEFGEYVRRTLSKIFTADQIFNFTSQLLYITKLDDDALQEA